MYFKPDRNLVCEDVPGPLLKTNWAANCSLPFLYGYYFTSQTVDLLSHLLKEATDCPPPLNHSLLINSNFSKSRKASPSSSMPFTLRFKFSVK